MKILLITNDIAPKIGGISTYINSLIEHMKNEVIIYSPKWAEGNKETKSNQSFIYPNKSTYKEIQKIIESNKIEAILHGSSNPQFLLIKRLKKFNIPQFMIIHGAEFNILKSIPILKKFLKNNLNELKTIFSVSFFTARKLKDLVNTEIQVVKAGISKNDFEKEYKNKEFLTVGVSSRFVPRKKIDWVIDSVSDLADRGRKVELKVFGFGKQESYLKKLANISPVKIEFFSDKNQNSIEEFYQSLDVFVMPSKSRYFGKEYEGLGLVYLEAASFGLPVLVGSSGGAFETIIPGKTGFIVSSRKDISDALTFFIDNPEKIKEFGLASKDFVENEFNWEKVSELIENSIQSKN